MPKQHWWIIITYILMQLSGFVGLPLLYMIGITDSPIAIEGFVFWSLWSFSIALIIIFILSVKSQEYSFTRTGRKSVPASVLWIVIGSFLALFAQGIAGAIEMYVFNVDPGSENTRQLQQIAEAFPIFILVFTIIGPILEEIVFRQVIFGAFYQRFNFWIAVLLSSLLFGIVHAEMEHLLIYTAVGAVFAYLYVKTKRLIVPIIAHMATNSLAALPIIFADEFEKLQENLPQWIGFIPL